MRRAPANVLIRIRPLTSCSGLPVCLVLSNILRGVHFRVRKYYNHRDRQLLLPPRVPMDIQERRAPGMDALSVRRKKAGVEDYLQLPKQETRAIVGEQG